MREILTRIFTVALLALVSMGVRAQISIDLGGEKNDGVYAGGTIAAKQNDAKDGKVTVTLIATPETGYSINKDDIYVYETISPNSTRTDEQPNMGNRLKLDGPDGDFTKATEYTVTIDANFGLWVKEANFTKNRDSKGGTENTETVVVNAYLYYVETTTEGNTVRNYLAHCGNDVNLASNQKQAVTAPTEFNPNTCLWEIDLPTGNTQVRGYGTSSHNSGYCLTETETKSEAATAGKTYYSLAVKSGSGREYQTTLTEPKAWPSSIISVSGAHYLRYHTVNGWILVQNNSSTPYGESTAPTVKKAKVMTYAEGQNLIIDCPDVIESDGVTPTLRALNCGKAYIHTVIDGTENHYWYDDGDHTETPTVTTLTPSAVTWSLAEDDLEYASIDAATGVITVKKQVEDNITLTLSCSATVGGNVMNATRSITLRGEYYAIKASTLYMVKSGTTLANSDSFNPDNGIWTREVNGTGHAFSTNINSTPYYISEGNWKSSVPYDAVLVAKNSLTGGVLTNNQRWMASSPMKSTRDNYIKWSSTKWELTKETENIDCAVAYPVTLIEQKYYTTVSATIGGGRDEIDYMGEFDFSVTETIENNPYVAYTFDNHTHYWYEASDHIDSEPVYWGEISSFTKTWSLADGDETYATVDASTGELTVINLPTEGNATITLTYTISNGDSQSFTTSKTITLKPEAIQPPEISLTTEGDETKLNISSAQSGLTFYYETGKSEPTTPEPTTSSTLYEEPIVIDDDVTCIKAIAVHHSNCSEVITFNILRFSTETVGTGENAVTVAPLVYSSDLETPDDMTAYIVSRVTPLTSSVALTEIAYIPKDVPVLLLDKGKHTGARPDITLSPKDEATPTVSSSLIASNLLKVSDGSVEVSDAQVYMYYQGEFVLTFNGTLKEGRFYLDNPNYHPTASSPSGTRLFLDFGNATDINGINDSVTDNVEAYYSLDGRRLIGLPTQKGIYISKGRKIVIK